MPKEDAIRAQEQLSLRDHSTTIGTILDGTDCKMLLGSGATKFYIKAILS